MENLSDDLLGDILCRIPEKDVVRCKCVSKSWHRTISDDLLKMKLWPNSPATGIYFRTLNKPRKLCDNFMDNFKDRLRYVRQIIRGRKRADFNYVSLEAANHNHFNYGDDGFSQLVDCCNGLQLLFNPNKCQYCVWNPTTKQCAHIPIRPCNREIRLVAALAFDPAESAHYKVVQINESHSLSWLFGDHCPNSSVVIVIDLFSSETAQWTQQRLQLQPLSPSLKWRPWCYWRHFAYFRGVLYWMVSSTKLFCIDLVNNIDDHFKTPSQINLPDRAVDIDADDADPTDMCSVGCVGVSMNHLYYSRRESGAFCIWFHAEDEWVLRFCVPYSRVHQFLIDNRIYRRLFRLWIEPFAVSPNADLLFIGNEVRLLSYNLRSNDIKVVHEVEYGRALAGCFLPFHLSRSCLVQFHKLDMIVTSTPS